MTDRKRAKTLDKLNWGPSRASSLLPRNDAGSYCLHFLPAERKAQGARVIAKSRAHPSLANRKPLAPAGHLHRLTPSVSHDRRYQKEGTVDRPGWLPSREQGLLLRGLAAPRAPPAPPTTPLGPLLRVCPDALSQGAETPANTACPSQRSSWVKKTPSEASRAPKTRLPTACALLSPLCPRGGAAGEAGGRGAGEGLVLHTENPGNQPRPHGVSPERGG